MLNLGNNKSSSNYQFLYILILILVITYIVYFSRLFNESYDASINYSLIDCARACKIDSLCKGFGYDMKSNSCYMSKEPINGKILTQLYSNKYRPENIKCNKILQYTFRGEMTDEDRKNNSLFFCKNHPLNKNKSLWYQNNGKFKEVKDIDKIDDLDSPEKYKIYSVEWPESDFDSDEFQAKIDLIYGKNDIDFTQIDNKMSLGGYLYPYQCIRDIDIVRCKEACLNRSTCKGIEYNTNFKDYHNVCCLKSDVSNIVDRDNIYKNGTLYVKNSRKSNL